MDTTTNKPDELRDEIEKLAAKKNLGIRFAQTNYINRSCTSRVYIYPIDADAKVHNVFGKAVIESWEFNQSQKSGTTVKCERYRVYSEVLDYLKSFNGNIIQK